MAADEPMDEAAILRVLDAGCRDVAVPMLDNGHVYLAAARCSLHRSDVDWAIVFEIFGFSPRSGAPDLGIWTLGSGLVGRQPASDYASEKAYRSYLSTHLHDDATFVSPLDAGWQDADNHELVATDAARVHVRGTPVEVPDRAELERRGIRLVDANRIRTFELCRYLAAVERDRVLATPEERRSQVPPELGELLVLDEWHHPDTVAGEVTSDTAAFRSIARVLATGDLSLYDGSEPGNTHWSNWPDGGSL